MTVQDPQQVPDIVATADGATQPAVAVATNNATAEGDDMEGELALEPPSLLCASGGPEARPTRATAAP